MHAVDRGATWWLGSAEYHYPAAIEVETAGRDLSDRPAKGIEQRGWSRSTLCRGEFANASCCARAGHDPQVIDRPRTKASIIGLQEQLEKAVDHTILRCYATKVGHYGFVEQLRCWNIANDGRRQARIKR